MICYFSHCTLGNLKDCMMKGLINYVTASNYNTTPESSYDGTKIRVKLNGSFKTR